MQLSFGGEDRKYTSEQRDKTQERNGGQCRKLRQGEVVRSARNYNEEGTFVLRPDQREGASHRKVRGAHSRERNSKGKGPEVAAGLARCLGTARSGVSLGSVVGDRLRLVGRESDIKGIFSQDIGQEFFPKYIGFQRNSHILVFQ